MLRRVSDDLAPDDAVLAIYGDMAFVAEGRDGEVDRLAAVRASLRLGILDGPARVRVLLRCLRRLVGPDLLRGLSRLDRRLFAVGVALARHGN